MKTGWTERDIDLMTRTEFFRFLGQGRDDGDPDGGDDGQAVAHSFEEARRMGMI